MAFTCPIDWDTLRISPQSVDKPAAKEPVKKAGKAQEKLDKAKQEEPATDLPWN
jgi:hypothetical protein